MASYSTCSPTAKVLQKVLSLYFFFFLLFCFRERFNTLQQLSKGSKTMREAIRGGVDPASPEPGQGGGGDGGLCAS